MKRDARARREAGRAIQQLMNELVEMRLANRPDADEAQTRRELTATLREYAGLEPNRLEPAANESAVWVLMALLEMERDRAAAESAGNLSAPACV